MLILLLNSYANYITKDVPEYRTATYLLIINNLHENTEKSTLGK